jgi:hypothetical protein
MAATTVGTPLLTESGAIRWGTWAAGSVGLGVAIWVVTHEQGAYYNPWIIIGGELALATLFVVAMARSTVLRVDIDPFGVTFIYLLRKHRGNWEDIAPGNRPPWRGIWVVRQTLARKPVSRIRRHFVTIDMGRAIVDSPFHPPWEVPERILGNLGAIRNRGEFTTPGGAR